MNNTAQQPKYEVDAEMTFGNSGGPVISCTTGTVIGVATRLVGNRDTGAGLGQFFGSDRGGHTLAVLASFTATFEQLGLNRWAYLKETLTA